MLGSPELLINETVEDTQIEAGLLRFASITRISSKGCSPSAPVHGIGQRLMALRPRAAQGSLEKLSDEAV